MAKKWKMQNVSKEDMDNHSCTTKVEAELDRLSNDGWNVHTVLDNYSANPGSRKFVTIVCWKDEAVEIAKA